MKNVKECRDDNRQKYQNKKALCSPSFSQRSVATRVCPQRVAIAGHVIKLKLTRRGNTLASI